ncbi:hypothetical protein CMV_013921 [Castanea mollissima]|uniref:Pentatricopeptide repeat-containing protein n=1 Tax=Castanea mollissima TaxID=60419 RepID=A0A8J4R6S9_9ROSI|nr:hypothetical protein CMV_013921 [Castanea mollissima]
MHSATLTASPKLSTAFFSSYLFIVSPTSLLAMFLLPVALVVGKGEFPIIPSAMISACKLGLMKEAYQVVGEMRRNGLAPDAVTWRILDKLHDI